MFRNTTLSRLFASLFIIIRMPKKTKILSLVRKFIDAQKDVFIAGETYVRTSGASWDAEDVASLVELALDRWYTDGKYGYEFERFMAGVVKQRHVTLCNSGSSANLLAMSALMSKQLKGKELKKGDEVITVAAGFPTTVNPIIQNGLIPVFVDTSLPTYNALPHAIEEAISDKTRAIFIAHTLGNPYKAQEIRDLADRNGLWIIADCCDALGAEHLNKPLPWYADISTFSFYPAHHISMGEGGAVSTDSPLLNKIIRAFRDWGRDCWCLPGKDNTCGKRFNWQLGDLPCGFDHKYMYSEVGYNLKATDLQAALGVTQIKKLPQFVQTRRENWAFYRGAFDCLEKFFVLPEPTVRSTPSWFGFTMTVREDAPFTRLELVTWLEEQKIGTRMLFGGNLTRQPAYQDVKYRVSGALKKSDTVAENTFWMGVAPIITRPMQEYVADKMMEFTKTK
jgi:CDP-6-deoxy-D-xylo-4-hexulose-3-dehydrase